MTVAVDFSPLNNGPERLRLAERRPNRTPIEPFKRRSATHGFCAHFPWAKAHGYRHGLALRGRIGSALATQK